MKVKVKAPFYDRKDEKYREVGQIFEAEDDRCKYLTLQGLVEKVETEAAEADEQLKSKPKAQK